MILLFHPGFSLRKDTIRLLLSSNTNPNVFTHIFILTGKSILLKKSNLSLLQDVLSGKLIKCTMCAQNKNGSHSGSLSLSIKILISLNTSCHIQL